MTTVEAESNTATAQFENDEAEAMSPSDIVMVSTVSPSGPTSDKDPEEIELLESVEGEDIDLTFTNLGTKAISSENGDGQAIENTSDIAEDAETEANRTYLEISDSGSNSYNGSIDELEEEELLEMSDNEQTQEDRGLSVSLEYESPEPEVKGVDKDESSRPNNNEAESSSNEAKEVIVQKKSPAEVDFDTVQNTGDGEDKLFTVIILHTDVFPYLLTPVNEDILHQLSLNYENILNLFDDDTALDCNICGLLEKIRETFKTLGNPFSEADELMLNFKDFGVSLGESNVEAKRLKLSDILKAFYSALKEKSQEEKICCLNLELSSEKSFIKYFNKMKAMQESEPEAEADPEPVRYQQTKSEVNTAAFENKGEEDIQSPIELSEEEISELNNDMSTEKAQESVVDRAVGKRPIEELEDGVQEAEDDESINSKRQK